MRDADLKNVSFFAHTLQLSLHDAVLSQQTIADLVSASRKLVGHFKHSSSATSRLHAIQEELGLPNHQLCQDVVARWNATYTMLERLSEQKRAICLFLSESDDVKGLGLTSYQWTLMGRVVSILQPFAQLTCEISSSTACLSLVLPAVQAILVFLQNDVCDTGLKKTVSEIILALKNHFSQLFDEPLYIVLTSLDPRFKLQCISDEVQRVQAKSHIVAAVLHHHSQNTSVTVTTTDSSQQDEEEPVVKKQCNRDFWATWESMTDLQPTASISHSVQVETEVSNFLAEPCVPRVIDLVVWWHGNANRFSLMTAAAKQYLAAPPTSVPSERLFSSAGDIFSEKRSCLLAENVERLVFLKANMPIS